ncbi:MAG: hypothetical protein HC897_02810 [Thermoanaerobaculia bacterium]|nr:hypothetical protein [Thermoanaerobaculia bacterium]
MPTGEAHFGFVQTEFDPAEKPDLFSRLVVFHIERASISPFEATREIIWQNETSYYPAAVPWPAWYAKLLCDPDAEAIHLILAYSISVTSMSLDFYSVGMTSSEIVLWPAILTLETPMNPHLRLKSLANYAAELYYKGGGLRSLDATLTDGHVELVIAFRNEKIVPIHFDIDLETKEIRRISEEAKAKGDTPP